MLTGDVLKKIEDSSRLELHPAVKIRGAEIKFLFKAFVHIICSP